MCKDSLVVNEKPSGTLVAVRARVGGSINASTCVRHGALLVSVTQAAGKGEANAAIASVLAKFFGCGKHQVEISLRSNFGG